jgi:hypothetical protein
MRSLCWEERRRSPCWEVVGEMQEAAGEVEQRGYDGWKIEMRERRENPLV